MPTHIEWSEETLNPITGCDRVSEGCDHCYIERTIPFRMAGRRFDENGHIDLQFHPDRLDQLLSWRKPRRVFINSLSDLFHPDVPYDLIVDTFAHMAAAPQHQCQVLTKRPKRMAEIVGDVAGEQAFHDLVRYAYESLQLRGTHRLSFDCPSLRWPVPNVWLGTSVELDKYSFRANWLRRTPAAVRWLSLEPLLGPLPSLDLTGIDWVVVGGESGPGSRPMHPEWARDIRARCVAAGVPFFFKQWGDWSWTYAGRPSNAANVVLDDGRGRFCKMWRVGKKAAGRLLDGREWSEYPEAHDG